MLEEAGWVDQDSNGIRECHGCANAQEGDEFRFELITYSEYGEPLTLTQQLIGEMLKNVGIQADLSQSQGSVMWADSASNGIEQNGDFNIDLYDDGYAGTDPTDFIWQYYNSASAEPDQGWNIGRWKSEEMDELLNQAYILDEQERQKIFCQMAKLLDDELPQILLFSTINADAYSSRVSGVQASSNSPSAMRYSPRFSSGWCERSCIREPVLVTQTYLPVLIILKGEKPLTCRPGELLEPVDFAAKKQDLELKLGHNVSDREVLSAVLYPGVFEEFDRHRQDYSDTSFLPTPVFFYALDVGDEVSIDIEDGKTLIIKLNAIGRVHDDGNRNIYFELNGEPRVITVKDQSVKSDEVAHEKADPANLKPRS